MLQTDKPYYVHLIDDDLEMRESLLNLFRRAGWKADAFASAVGVANKIASQTPDVVVTDVKMPKMSGIDLLKELDSKTSPPVILISAHGDIPMAVEAMQLGAYSFFEKPFDPRRLLMATVNAAKRHQLALKNKMLEARLADLSGLDRVLLGNHELIVGLKKQILDLAGLELPVLILGETGSGKEIVARALHDISQRSPAPFLPVNCAAIPSESFEQVMFGTTDGDPGYLGTAEGGTVFLDELGALPVQQQVKLLRVVEHREYTPFGSTEVKNADIRFVSATNGTINEMISAGTLREDLIFRLNNFTLKIPPLRERKEDITLLFSHFSDHFSLLYETAKPDLDTSDMAALLAHEWPGNVRELRNVAERLVLLARRGSTSVSKALGTDEEGDDIPDTLRNAVAVFERELISKSIKAHKGKMDAVAEALGIGRRTLNEKIVKLDLDKSQII